MFPYLGFGGTANLEAIHSLCTAVVTFLRSQGDDADGLRGFEESRRKRVSYLQRVSRLFEFSIGNRVTGSVRDWNMSRLSRRPGPLYRFMESISSGGVPNLATRTSMLLP